MIKILRNILKFVGMLSTAESFKWMVFLLITAFMLIESDQQFMSGLFVGFSIFFFADCLGEKYPQHFRRMQDQHPPETQKAAVQPEGQSGGLDQARSRLISIIKLAPATGIEPVDHGFGDQTAPTRSPIIQED